MPDIEFREEWVLLTCPKCGHQWEEKLVENLDGTTFEHGRGCPKCGEEGQYE